MNGLNARSRSRNNETQLENSNFVDMKSGETNGNSNSPESLISSKMHWWYEDRSSVLLLLFLYILQGIPLGLAGSIPMLLAAKSIDYKQQALFSFVFWPFSIKLLWAPLVDGAYIQNFGRRKTWLVPTQYVIGIIMMILSFKLDSILGGSEPDVWKLTVCFFILNFCAATQDIAVDGWALTMLSKKNVGLASTCNSVGQTAGYFLGYVVFLALESADFCNKYLRFVPQEVGLINLAGFMYFWAIVFFITTTLVMLFKSETTENHSDDSSNGVVSTYKLLFKIICLPNVLQYVVILLTAKIGFASESIVALKLIECGIHKETLALLAIPLTPLQIALPLVIAKYTSGPRPLDIFLKAVRYRLIFTVWFAAVIYWTPSFKQADGSFPYYYFGIILVTYFIHQVALYSMFVSVMAFNAKISDPKIGGTYMTLLNTVANLGGTWPSTLALWYVGALTTTNCVGGTSNLANCDKESKAVCESSGGTCVTTIDGFYIECAICLVLGVFWLIWKSGTVRRLQNMGLDRWRCPT
uniref:Acetyl-coenzyme A transporter 1 n=1 Tax=Ciona savignyi TaxID=51511 RepID=H2Z3B5_CIOSA